MDNGWVKKEGELFQDYLEERFKAGGENVSNFEQVLKLYSVIALGKYVATQTSIGRKPTQKELDEFFNNFRAMVLKTAIEIGKED